MDQEHHQPDPHAQQCARGDGGGGTSLTHDNRGNLAVAASSRTYSWNHHNALQSTTTNSAPGYDGVYRYDILGRRVTKYYVDDSDPMNVVQRWTLFINSLAQLPPLGNAGGQVVAEYERTTTNGSGAFTLARQYVYGEYVDEPLALIDYTAAGSVGVGTAETFYYHRNRQYSIIGLTDASGNVAELYAYSPYGETQVFDASASPLSGSALGNCVLYTGRYLDTETGLYQFRARYIDPGLGRGLLANPGVRYPRRRQLQRSEPQFQTGRSGGTLERGREFQRLLSSHRLSVQ